MSKAGVIVHIVDIAGEDVIGEVQTTPTSNTLLRRVKDLLTGIVLAAGTAVIGKIRLVAATGDEITNDTIDAIQTVGIVKEATLHASGAETATVTGADVDVAVLPAANFYLDVTAVSGSTPTLDVKIQGKDSVSGKYFDLVSFTQATAVTNQRKNYGSGAGELLDKTIRYVATIGGTTPSFTFSLSLAGKTLGK